MTLGQNKPMMQVFVNGTGNAPFARTTPTAPDHSTHPGTLSQGATDSSVRPVVFSQGSGLDRSHSSAFEGQGSGSNTLTRPITLNVGNGSGSSTGTSGHGHETKLQDPSAPSRLSPAMSAQATELPRQVMDQVARPSEKIGFDFRQATMHKEKNVCTLICGSRVLASFGADEADAKRSLTALNHYQLTEMHRVGGPQSQFTYFLSHGKAPVVTDLVGQRSYSLDVPSLKVRQEKDGYVLANQQQSLWRFTSQEDAQTALAEIQRLGFDRIYYFGNGEGTGFTLLSRSK
jgi:hypothetical protein